LHITPQTPKDLMQQIVCIAVTRLAYLLPKLCTAQEKISLETLENAASSPPDGFVRTTSEIDFKKTAAERIALSAAVFVVR